MPATKESRESGYQTKGSEYYVNRLRFSPLWFFSRQNFFTRIFTRDQLLFEGMFSFIYFSALFLFFREKSIDSDTPLKYISDNIVIERFVVYPLKFSLNHANIQFPPNIHFFLSTFSVIPCYLEILWYFIKIFPIFFSNNKKPSH